LLNPHVAQFSFYNVGLASNLSKTAITASGRAYNLSKVWLYGLFLEKEDLVFLIPHLSHQLALMMILNTWASFSKKCSSTPEPLVHFAPKCYAGSDEYFIKKISLEDVFLV